MGMSMHIDGIVAPDEKWQKMKAVYDSCIAAELAIPAEVEAFFEGEVPNPNGVVVDLRKAISVRSFNDPLHPKDGVTITLKELLRDYPNLTHIRFYNSY